MLDEITKQILLHLFGSYYATLTNTNLPIILPNPLFINHPISLSNPLFTNQSISLSNPLFTNQSFILSNPFIHHYFFLIYYPKINVLAFFPIHSPRRYNPCRVLADSRNRLQPSLSMALILQFPTPSLSASLVTPSI